MSYYDPYKVLQVNYSDDLETIRDSFRKMALIHHPDRGGNPKMFDLIRKSYKDIFDFRKNQERHLQREARNISKMRKERATIDTVQLNENEQKSIERNFNRIFQNTRVETANDRGYGNNMVESSNHREDDKNIKRNPVKKFEKQIVIYEEPEGINLLGQNYEELGQTNIKDFSKRNLSGQQYTDYMVAHSDSISVNDLQNLPNIRKDYKSVNELKNSRSKVSHRMSPEQLAKYNTKIQREKDMEERRQMMFYQHKKDVEKKYNSIRNFLTL